MIGGEVVFPFFKVLLVNHLYCTKTPSLFMDAKADEAVAAFLLVTDFLAYPIDGANVLIILKDEVTDADHEVVHLLHRLFPNRVVLLLIPLLRSILLRILSRADGAFFRRSCNAILFAKGVQRLPISGILAVYVALIESTALQVLSLLINRYEAGWNDMEGLILLVLSCLIDVLGIVLEPDSLISLVTLQLLKTSGFGPAAIGTTVAFKIVIVDDIQIQLSGP